jgi:hypothetical protein
MYGYAVVYVILLCYAKISIIVIMNVCVNSLKIFSNRNAACLDLYL